MNNNLLEVNIKKTIDLLENSYSPYSKFRVASSLITKDNKFYGGVNIENISFGLTNCAERSAIFNALSNGIKVEDIDYIIIVSDCTSNLLPCGACLQVFNEFLNSDTNIIIPNINNKKYEIIEYKLKDLTPKSFKM